MQEDGTKSASYDFELARLHDIERLAEIKDMLQIATGELAMPLYLVFWLCDLIYAPEHKWLFLLLRSSVLGLCLITRHLIHRPNLDLRSAESICCLYAFGCGIAITLMTLIKDGPSSPYYAGLNLVCVGLLFLPVSAHFLKLNIASIFAPFYLGQAYLAIRRHEFSALTVHSFFVFSTVIITVVIGAYFRKLRSKELESRFQLEQEITNRGQIIRQKTNEAIRLKALSAQFSPQVVHMIRKGQIELDEKLRSKQVCSIFVDVVESTERVTKIDNRDLNQVISMFIEDTIKSLLKYDITVDKFLGDGVLAFSNSPVQYEDFVERTLMAALDIRNLITSHAEEYQSLWRKPFELRMGIAAGHATVGFYGNKNYFNTFTAIGPCVNLASRLCAVADPGTIAVSNAVVESSARSGFRFKPQGKRVLKGFESQTQVFLLEGGPVEQFNIADDLECPQCHGIMHITSNGGIYNLQCRNCGVNQPQSVQAA